jgi:pyridoxal phosphate enzyme (YggS family)
VIEVTENLGKIRDLLAAAATEAGRDPAAVKLLAVSKKQPLERIHAAIAAGQRDFGENQVQEGVDKIALLAGHDLVWHFIGHLQSNKTRVVAEHFDWVHSIDSFKTARRLSEQRPDELDDLDVCLQVNVDDEASKSGIAPAALPDLARRVAELPRLRLRGLMCLPRIRQGFAAQREPFARLRQLAADLTAAGIVTDTLSMGMSDDFRAAIFEGATIVRIGTAVFGQRITA